MKKIFFILLITSSRLPSFCQEGSKPFEGPEGVDRIYNLEDIQEQPEFPGGELALFKFIKDNLRYPEAEKKRRIEGNVYIAFVIHKNGTVMKAEIYKGVEDGPGLNQEALRITQLMPPWKPGMLEGKPVKVNYMIPFSFKLDFPTHLPRVIDSPQHH